VSDATILTQVGFYSINPLVEVHTVNDRFTHTMIANTSDLPELSTFDLMVDCTDNATTRYLLSDLAVKHNVTLVSGGAVGLEGWVGVWNLPVPAAEVKSIDKSIANGPNSQQVTTSRGPCLRCVYTQSTNDNSGNCEDDGILGPVVGTIGVLMATEAVKLLVGLHGELSFRKCVTLLTQSQSTSIQI
jgi:adenylyltransferase/sulfurtransferase